MLSYYSAETDDGGERVCMLELVVGTSQAGKGLEDEDDHGTLTVWEVFFVFCFVLFLNVLFQHWLSAKSRMLVFVGVFKIGIFTLLDKQSLYIGSHSKRETKEKGREEGLENDFDLRRQ